MKVLPPFVSSLPALVLIAQKSGIDANALATTTLTYSTNLSASNTIPLFAKITVGSGTLLLLVFTVRLNGVILKAVAAVTSALAGAGPSYLTVALNTDGAGLAIPTTSNYDVNVTTINGSTSTINVEVWGIRYT